VTLQYNGSMSNPNPSPTLTRIRSNTYKLELSYAVIVLKTTQAGTEIYALNSDNQPELVTTSAAQIFTTIREIEEGICEPLHDFYELQDEISQCRSEIAAEEGYKRYLENRDWVEYEAFDRYERSLGLS
jgi:hypothetical protein